MARITHIFQKKQGTGAVRSIKPPPAPRQVQSQPEPKPKSKEEEKPS